jgi:uncharacterized protein (DUF433 family)
MKQMTTDSARELERLRDLVVWQDSDRMSGAPCFVGTRVPVQTLFDYLESGDSLDAFLADFPGVTYDQAVAALRVGKDVLLAAGIGA